MLPCCVAGWLHRLWENKGQKARKAQQQHQRTSKYSLHLAIGQSLLVQKASTSNSLEQAVVVVAGERPTLLQLLNLVEAVVGEVVI
jgi:hypothetical protein